MREMSNLETLEDIAGQTAFHINQKPRNLFGWYLSPSIERAKAARERKEIAAAPKQKKCEPVIEAIAPPFTSAEITDYDSLIRLLRNRADELELSRETINHIAHLPDGLAGKILGLRHVKRIGMQTLGPLLDALGLKLIAVPNEAALERNRSRYVKRDEAHYRSAKARHGRKPRCA